MTTPAIDASDLPQETNTNASAANEDPRPEPRFESKPRARALLVSELEALQHLAAATPVTAPDHPQISRRIAEDFVELERAAKNEGSSEMQINARNKAISAYAKLVEDHPDYVQLDEALYELATEYERAGDWDLALSAYQRVLRDPPPRNDVYGYAWYKVGWVLRNKGDVDGARQAFKEAIAYATEYSSAPGSAKLAEASRDDLRAL